MGELRTQDPKFINESRKYWYGMAAGRYLKNYKKVCTGQTRRPDCGQTTCGNGKNLSVRLSSRYWHVIFAVAFFPKFLTLLLSASQET